MKWRLISLALVVFAAGAVIWAAQHQARLKKTPPADLEPELISESGFHFEVHPTSRSRQALIEVIGEEHAARFDVGKYHRETRPHDDGFLETGSINFFEVSLREGSVSDLYEPLRRTWEKRAGQYFRLRKGIVHEHLSLIHERIPETEKRHIRKDHLFSRFAFDPDHDVYLSEQSGEGFYILSLDD